MTDLTNVWKLIGNAKFVELGFVDDNGMPNIRKMYIQREYRSLDRHFISTNTLSFHIKQLVKNNKACLYYSADKAFE